MRLSIIVPAYNEERTIKAILKRLDEVRQPDWQIIVVDDGSKDDTRNILRASCQEYEFDLILRDQNGGKTAAVRSGLDAAQGDFVLFQDADMEYDPDDIRKLLGAVEDSNSVVYGKRPSYWNNPRRWVFASGVLVIDLSFLLFYGRFVRDHATCYKLVPRHLIQLFQLESTGFEGCVEITAKLMKAKIAIKQIPISYHPRSAKEGKKLTAMYGLEALQCIIKWRKWNPPKISDPIENSHCEDSEPLNSDAAHV